MVSSCFSWHIIRLLARILITKKPWHPFALRPTPHHVRIIIHFSNLVVVHCPPLHSITIVEKFDVSVIANHVWPLALIIGQAQCPCYPFPSYAYDIFIGHTAPHRTDLRTHETRSDLFVFCVVLVFLLYVYTTQFNSIVTCHLSLVWHFPNIISVGLRIGECYSILSGHHEVWFRSFAGRVLF